MKRTARRATPALFVYGSLLHKKYWRHAIGSIESAAIRLKPARLRGWRRWWNGVRRGYGGAVLNMKRAPGHVIWGAVVEGLSPEAWAALDRQERSHLPRERVMIVTEHGRRLWAVCYRQRVRGPERRPSPDYVAAVRAGAHALGVSVSRNVEDDVRRLAIFLAARRPGSSGAR
jgi:gamma-glutamylcyclotransferase (GGCT)/AIG2-like uncharacterized protein YtfP